MNFACNTPEVGKRKLRVYNPTVKEQGWQPIHAIEIVSDDCLPG
ncbi:MAG: hypothetical protein ACREEM_12415 [Blastocatellia bacterium]